MIRKIRFLFPLIVLAGLLFPAYQAGLAQEEHEHIHAAIDVKPGSDPNTINLRTKGLLPVALLGSASFDVSEVDTASVRFGRHQHESAEAGAAAVRFNFDDANGDGYLDLVFFFYPGETGLQPGDTEACLHGTINGEHFCGHDSVRIIA
jgi:hypothetical protein